MKLLSSASANSKTRKTQDGQPDYRIVTLSLSPDKSAEGYPTNCPNSVPSCVDACVGNVNVGLAGIWKSIMDARKRKTAFMRDDRKAFLAQLIDELKREQERADIEGTVLAARLNCFSDLPWELPSFGSMPEKFPDASFWDYTKVYKRVGNAGPNYHLTASWTEKPEHQDDCAGVIEAGHNVAVVFGQHGKLTGWRAYGQELPRTFVIGGHRRIVFDGDTNDMRFLDWRASENGARLGRVCGLRLKSGNGAMRERALESGFAVNTGK